MYTEERIDQIAEKYGLNDPIAEQFADYVTNVAQGDLGVSIRTVRSAGYSIDFEG